MDREITGNKIVVCIEEYPPKEEDDENDSNKVKKNQQIYEINSTHSNVVDDDFNEKEVLKFELNDTRDGRRGLENIPNINDMRKIKSIILFPIKFLRYSSRIKIILYTKS